MEYSLFMIKPCAYDKKDEIIDIISQKLIILSLSNIILSEEFLERLYRNEEDNGFKEANIQFLKNGKACIGIVSGENAIQDLINICGDKPLGSKCEKETIRYKFNPEVDKIIVGEQLLFINAIHKSDINDAKDDVDLYYSYFYHKTYQYKKSKKIIYDKIDL